MTGDDKLDLLLTQHFREDTRADGNHGNAAARVLTALARPLPQQRGSWRHWPAALLDWQFAPAWPRMAALAGCAVLGFAIGAVAPSARALDTQLFSAHADVQLVAVLSEPEGMMGVLP
jgi:hypothetical protein